MKNKKSEYTTKQLRQRKLEREAELKRIREEFEAYVEEVGGINAYYEKLSDGTLPPRKRT